ncbi:MAG: NADAR family protein [Candidatus Hodarchaeales archaeon]
MKDKNEEMILFYKSKDPYGWMSNLYHAPITMLDPLQSNQLDGPEYLTFKTSEHAYQYAKCKRADERNAILLVPGGVHAAILGHGLFDNMIVDNWDEIKVNRMRECLRAKFDQHPYLKQKLLDTGDDVLVEDSPTDSFWGLGPAIPPPGTPNSPLPYDSVDFYVTKRGWHSGQNVLGKLLMGLRKELRE